jgi:PBP1b-binding outer membrane lipoprotein LpoB
MPFPSRFLVSACLAVGVLAAGCSSTEEKPTVAAPPPAPQVVALPYEQAVRKAAQDLLTNANLAKDQKYSMVVDPLVDGNSGMQTEATVAMEQSVVQLVKENYQQVDVKPFNNETVATLPLLMVGTFTPINLQGKADGERDAYRICFALADLKTGKIISKGLARALPEGFDPTPPRPHLRGRQLGIHARLLHIGIARQRHAHAALHEALGLAEQAHLGARHGAAPRPRRRTRCPRVHAAVDHRAGAGLLRLVSTGRPRMARACSSNSFCHWVDHGHHAGVVRARADLAEPDLVALDEQLHAKQLPWPPRLSVTALAIWRERSSAAGAHGVRLPAFHVVAADLHVADGLAEVRATWPCHPPSARTVSWVIS